MIKMDTSFEIKHCENSAIDKVDFNNIAFGKVFSDGLLAWFVIGLTGLSIDLSVDAVRSLQ